MLFNGPGIWLLLLATTLGMLTVVFYSYWPLIAYLLLVMVAACLLFLLYVIAVPEEKEG